MAQNIDFSSSDQIQTPQYPDVHPPSQEMNEEVFQAKGDLMKSIETILEKFNCIPFEEKPQILFQAWEFFFAIQYSKLDNPNELFQKLLEDLKELAEYNNSPSKDRPNFLNDNEEHYVRNEESLENSSTKISVLNSNQEKEGPSQESDIRHLIREERYVEASEEQKQSMEDTMLELVKICRQKELFCMHDNEVKNVVEQLAERGNHIKSLQNFRVIHKSSISFKNTSQISSIHAVTTILSTKEPEYSPSMGYENSNTTLETKLDEIMKSGVEELVQILSENEVTLEDKRECDMLVCEDSSTSDVCDDHSKIFSDSKNDDDISVYDDDFEDVEYVEASLSNPEIVSVEEENESDNSLSDNFSPEFETFCDHTEETRSGNTTHADNSLPEYDLFCFKIEPDQERLINVKSNISDESSNDPLLEDADLFFAFDNSIPPGIENVADDSEGDIHFLEELLIDDSILSHESSDFNFEDNPSVPLPPPSILSGEVLPDVRSVYAIIYSKESYRVASGSIVGSSQRNQASAFVSNVPNRNNFQRSNQNSNNGPRPNNLTINRQCEGSALVCENCGFNGHSIDRCFKIIGYPANFYKKKRGQGFKGKAVSNNNSIGSCSSSGFTYEQMATLISLIKDNKIRKNVYINMKGVLFNKSHIFIENFSKVFCSNTNFKPKLVCNGKIFDLRENQHMAHTGKELDNGLDISHLKIKVGHPDGTDAFISKIGNLRLSNGLILYDVLVILEYCVTLISVHKLAKDNKIFVVFDESRSYFMSQDLNLRNVLGIHSQCEGLYYFDNQVLTAKPSSTNLKYSDVHQPSKEISIDELKIMMQSYCERMNEQRELEVLLAAQREQELLAQKQAAQEKEEPPQNSDFRQLIGEMCGIKASTEQKQKPEEMMLEWLELCREKELYRVHDSIEDLIGRATNTMLLSINLNLNNFRIIHKKSSISLNNTSQISLVNAITLDLPTKEPDNSLSMRDEHLSIIPEMESDKVIKSSVENLVPIPSESEVTSDNKKFSRELAHIDPVPPGIAEANFDLKEEIRLIKNFDSHMEEIDLFLATDDLMPLSIKNDDYDSEGDIHFLEELLSNDPLPLPENESSNFDHPDDLSFPHPHLKPPDVEIFFDFEHDTSVLTTKMVKDISEHHVLMPKVLPSQPTLCPNIDTLLLFSSKNKDKVFKPSILSYLLVSHRDKITFDFSENLMMMYGGDIPLLDVPYLHFYPL
nr:ribonuclease H-like domain-containing protein [Tanacetum cinerariifolium]